MHKYINKVTALMLSLMFTFTACFSAMSFKATAAQGNGYFNDDFSGGDLGNWDEKNNDGIYSIGKTDGDNALVFNYKKSPGKTNSLLLPKSGLVPTISLEEVNYSVKFTSDPTVYGGLQIIYDYTDNKNYRFVNIGTMSPNSFYRRDNEVKDGVVSCVSTSGFSSQFDFQNWVKVGIKYEDNQAIIVIGQGDKWSSFNYKTNTTPAVLSNYCENGNESSTMYYKDFWAYSLGYSKSISDTYVATNKGIFNKTLQDVSGNDATAIDTALNGFSQLSVYYQYKNYKYVVTLNGFLEKLNAGEGYDDKSLQHLANWKCIRGVPSKDNFSFDENGVLSISSGIVMQLNPSVYLGANQSIGSISYKILYSSGNKGGKGIRYVYNYTDDDNFLFNSIWYDTTHGFFNQNFKCEKGNLYSTGNGSANSIGDISGWLNVKIDFSETGKYSFTLSRDDNGNMFNFTSTSELNSLILYAETECKIKDIEIKCYDDDVAATGQKEVKLFRNNYEEILSLTPEMVGKNTSLKNDIEKAINDYNVNITEYAKAGLQNEYNLLIKLLDAINSKSGDFTDRPSYSVSASGEEYYDWSDDFENGLDKWANSTSFWRINTPSSSIAEDPSNSENHVARLTKYGFIYPSSYTLPDRAQLSEVTFRVRNTDTRLFSVSQPLVIMLSYKDIRNWQVLELYGMQQGDSKLSYRLSNCNDGTYSAGYHNSYKCDITDYTSDWVDIKLNYPKDGRTVAVEIDSGKMIDMFTQTLAVPYGQFGIWGQNDHAWLYDDVKIHYTKGDWEEDQKIENIYPYYSGNTQFKTGDVVTIFGENINECVTSVECAKISDEQYKNELATSAGSATSSFLPEISYNHDKQTGNFIKPAQEAYWNDLTAVKLKMMQPTSNSFKVILPEKDGKEKSNTDGIFALKLHGTDSSGSKDVIIYINNPQIDYINGNDGDHATVGGNLRIIGKNLALFYDEVDTKDFIKDSDADIQKLKNDLASNKYKLYVRVKNETYDRVFSAVDNSVAIQSRNSLILQLPDDIPLGDYEVSVYNGYGDSTCWSAPIEATIGVDVRSTWSQQVYDITNYGAVPEDSDQNITSILMNVIQIALDKTNGGIIRIPTGRYKLVYGLVIPAGIQLVGDGSDKTILYWEPFQWKINSCPPFLIACDRNISISGIGFYGTRGSTLFRTYGGINTQKSTTYNENIYMTDVRIQFLPFEGVVTGGSGTGAVIGSEAEAVALITSELAKSGTYGINIQNPYNLQFKNVELKRELISGSYNLQPFAMSYGKYVHLDGGYYCGGWMHGNINNFIFEYTEFACATLGFQGENSYYHGCKIYDRTINNRELFVADGSPASNGGQISAIMTLATQEECDKYGYTYGYVYKVLKGWKEAHDRIQLYVKSGQGLGQTRMMVKYDDIVETSVTGEKTTTAFVTVNKPFVVAPNSNSRIIARTARENMYFEYMFYNNGCATGYFGGFADTIYDHCVWKQVTGIYFDSYSADSNWYLTMIDGTYYDAYNLHDTGSSAWFTDYGSIIFTSQNNSGATLPTNCIRFYGNNLDGYQLYIKSYYADGMHDIVVQNNDWDNAITAITTTGGSHESGGDGIFIANNSVNDVKTYINNAYGGNNSAGGKRFINYTDTTSERYILGDVNGDGKITLKDATLIRLYVSEELALSEDQIQRADYYNDSKIDIKDAVAIRYFIATGENLIAGGGNTSSGGLSTDGDGYYDDIV